MSYNRVLFSFKVKIHPTERQIDKFFLHHGFFGVYRMDSEGIEIFITRKIRIMPDNEIIAIAERTFNEKEIK